MLRIETENFVPLPLQLQAITPAGPHPANTLTMTIQLTSDRERRATCKLPRTERCHAVSNPWSR
jgi:hypothetical protein